MKIDHKDIENNLPDKGFERVNDADHIYFHHEHNGKKTGAYTKLSRGSRHKEISGSLLTTVRLQLKLDRSKDAVNLVKCPMDGDQYNKLLREKGLLSDE